MVKGDGTVAADVVLGVVVIQQDVVVGMVPPKTTTTTRRSWSWSRMIPHDAVPSYLSLPVRSSKKTIMVGSIVMVDVLGFLVSGVVLCTVVDEY